MSKLNLPAARGTYTNYIQPTVRQLEYANSEVQDGAKRAMRSTIDGSVFGIGLDLSSSRISNWSYSWYNSFYGPEDSKK